MQWTETCATISVVFSGEYHTDHCVSHDSGGGGEPHALTYISGALAQTIKLNKFMARRFLITALWSSGEEHLRVLTLVARRQGIEDTKKAQILLIVGFARLRVELGNEDRYLGRGCVR